MLLRTSCQALGLGMALVACTTSGPDPVDTDSKITETDASPVETDVVDTQVETDAETDTEEPADPCLVEPVMFEVGTGETAFEVLSEGMVIELERGGQDPPGYHIWGSIRADNVPQFVTLGYKLTDVSTGVVLGDFNFNVGLVPIPNNGTWECTGRQFGMLGVLNDWRLVREAAGMADDAPIAEVFCGNEVQLDFRLKHRDVELAADSVTVVVQPSADEAPHCTTPNR